jgi:2-polyprenyl-6-hydroxyphenyl methylase/3-demethylubiquinone-9 3-methyltransferase
MTTHSDKTEDFSTSASVNEAELANFLKMADTWWDPSGPFKPLHLINPIRLEYIRRVLTNHFNKDQDAASPLKGIKILDLGCGGGLLSEPLAELGADVTGVDAIEKNIRVASLHASGQGLNIDYQFTTAEALVKTGAQFDVIINMEVIEHVADVGSFLGSCRSLIKPDGIMMISTLNKTIRSYLSAIIGAEYILGWLPKGTHDWNKFLKPSEFSRHLQTANFELDDIIGLVFHPLKNEWALGRDTSVNYLGFAKPI